MSDTVIRVENQSKKYVISHQEEGSAGYKSLQESMNKGVKLLGKKLYQPAGESQLGDFPQAEQYYREVISLTLYYGLTEADQDRIIQPLQEVLQ
jgi:dTDP-4-amino-4,6-dideoxygalactose transaminase